VAIATDPKYYEEPLEFRPWRFYEMTQDNSEDANHYQFTSTGINNLAFGRGRFSCPGRFFAAAQIKLLLACILINYDFSFPDQQEKRPPNLYIDERIAPDRSQKIRFQRRQRSE